MSSSASASEKVKRVTAARTSTSTHLKQAGEISKEKDRKHATHSKLITVVVKPATNDPEK